MPRAGRRGGQVERERRERAAIPLAARLYARGRGSPRRGGSFVATTARIGSPFLTLAQARPERHALGDLRFTAGTGGPVEAPPPQLCRQVLRQPVRLVVVADGRVGR